MQGFFTADIRILGAGADSTVINL